jgi:hypothetical protein
MTMEWFEFESVTFASKIQLVYAYTFLLFVITQFIVVAPSTLHLQKGERGETILELLMSSNCVAYVTYKAMRCRWIIWEYVLIYISKDQNWRVVLKIRKWLLGREGPNSRVLRRRDPRLSNFSETHLILFYHLVGTSFYDLVAPWILRPINNVNDINMHFSR